MSIVVLGQMTKLFSIFFCLFAFPVLAQSTCQQTAREVAPQISDETRRDFESRLTQAKENVAKNSNDVENLIWLGRRTAYLGQYKEAIRIYTQAIKRFPNEARLYRHRGHRFITLRCVDDAIADFARAARLVKGKPDEVEPDGLPNARNIPTSTLQSNICYHLGLAFYLKGDFRRALTAYREAEKVSKNADMLVATKHWLYMTLRRLGRINEANQALAPVSDGLDIIENSDYYKLIRLYQGKLTLETLLRESVSSQTSNNLSNATLGYGVGNWLFYNGRTNEAEGLFRQVAAGNQWASFGYIAAEIELTRSFNKR
jgi:tetratricopeptide (TPR) repeat protein